MAGSNPNNRSVSGTPETWQREKQGQGSPADWLAEKQGQGSPADWLAEKQGQGSPADWLAEKQGQGGPADWLAEKQGLSGQKIIHKRSSAVVWFGLLAVIIVLVASVAVVLATGGVTHPKTTPTVVAIAPATPTIVIVNPNIQLTVASLTSHAEQSQEAEQVYEKGVAASANPNTWDAAMLDFQQANSFQPNYKDSNTYLVTLYEEAGTNLIKNANGSTTLSDVSKGNGYFKQALLLIPTTDPTYAQVSSWIEQAEFYYNGLKEHDEKNWTEAITNLAALYKLDSNYKDVAQLLYDAYFNYGNALATSNHPGEAIINYQLAVALPVKDVSQAQTKLKQLQQQFATPSK